jgi:hypothetical protein
MKKEEIVQQLEAAKALTSQVDIDKVIALINQITPEFQMGITQALADEISQRIEKALDYCSDNLVYLDSAELELNYENRVEVTRIDVDVSSIMDHVVAAFDEYIIEEDECGPSEDEVMQSVNEGLGL